MKPLRLLYRCIFLIFMALYPFLLSAQEFHHPAKVIEIMERSKVPYKVMLEPDFQAGPPPRGKNNVPYLYQALSEDGPSIAQYEMDSLLLPLHEAAEKAFEAHQYAEARSHYLKVHEQRPELAVVITYIGQTYEAEGNLPEAMRWYAQAILVNYHDYMAHWFLAEACHELKRYDEAAEEIAVAWVLNRNHVEIQAAVRRIFKAAKLKLDDFEFIPNYSLDHNGEDIEIRFSEDWMMYAFCKALWRYEPGYHRELGGGRSEFDMVEEKECLLNVAMAYERLNKGKRGDNPALNALVRALEERRSNEFVFMELWLPQEPVIAYTQSKEAIQELALYVLQVRGRKK